MFDVAIIGTGPAGLSAALTLKLHNKDIKPMYSNWVDIQMEQENEAD